MEGNFDGYEVSHIGRGSNEEADNLANIGSQCLSIPPGVFWEEINERSIQVKKPADVVEPRVRKRAKPQADPGTTSTSESQSPAPEHDEEPEEVMMVETMWMQPYLVYLINKELPENPVEARRISHRSKAFRAIKGELYKRSISGVLQRCVTPEEGKAILKDIHEGICGHHASSRAIAAKAFRAGFYWLTAAQDAKDIVLTCDACQRFATKPHAPTAELAPIHLA